MSISSLRFGNATESFLSENMPKESKTATSEESLRLHVPELTRLSAELVREFVKDFESYRRRSGTARVRDGMSSATLKVLAHMGITTEPKVGDADAKSANDKEFIAALLGRFAPPDVDEAYEKEKEQESAKVAPPAASSGDVPMVPPTSDGGVVDKPTDRPKSNVECFRCLERGHRARACPYTEEEVRTKRGAAGTRQSGRG